MRHDHGVYQPDGSSDQSVGGPSTHHAAADAWLLEGRRAVADRSWLLGSALSDALWRAKPGSAGAKRKGGRARGAWTGNLELLNRVSGRSESPLSIGGIRAMPGRLHGHIGDFAPSLQPAPRRFHVREPGALVDKEIGRASCREREEISVGADA